MEWLFTIGGGLGIFGLVGYVFKQTLDIPKNYITIARFLILENDVKEIKEIVVRIDERLKKQ